MNTEWLLIIDTNKFAGEFEVEICDYITGQCDVESKEAMLARSEIPDMVDEFGEAMTWFTDEHGRDIPVEIWPTPGWFNHGLGKHFQYGQESEALADYIQCVEKYCLSQIEGVKRNSHKSWTPEAKEIEIKALQDKMMADKASGLKKYPAYMSVAIHFKEKPSASMIGVIKQRAHAFVDHVKSTWIDYRTDEYRDFEITGFRLVRKEIVFKEES